MSEKNLSAVLFPVKYCKIFKVAKFQAVFGVHIEVVNKHFIREGFILP